MTTADIITELLGERWWEREHDRTALCALLDRVMELTPCDLNAAGFRVFETSHAEEASLGVQVNGGILFPKFRIRLLAVIRLLNTGDAE